MVDIIKVSQEITRFYWVFFARSFSNSIVYILRRAVIGKRSVEMILVDDEVLLGALEYP